MLASDVMNRATTFIVYALVARYLGAYAVGQLALALTLFFTFHVFATAGVKTLIAREVARDRAATDHYLVGSTLFVAVCSGLSFAALLGLVRVMNYNADTALVIWVLALGLLPASLSAVSESIMWAWERMHLIAIASVPVSIGKVVVCFVILSRGHGLYEVVVTLLLCRVVLAAIEWCLLLWYVRRPRLVVDVVRLRVLVRQAMPFLGLDALVSIQPAIIALLLSKLAGETEVGLYNAGDQLLVPVGLVCTNIMVSVFPAMCKTLGTGVGNIRTMAEYLLESLLVFAVPAATGLFLLSKEILLLVYGNEDFLYASVVLRVLVWSLILDVYTHTLGHLFMAGHREKTNLAIVAVDVVASLLVGVVLIQWLGLVGAAATALVVRVIDFLLHYILVARMVSGIPVAKVLWKPAVASAAMAACLVAAQLPGLLAPIVVGAVAYAGVLLGLAVWTHGGVRPLADRYRHGWLDQQGEDPV
jgi:O-antigen/teichoic acid export membrane protein